jgi:hypothetical protein
MMRIVSSFSLERASIRKCELAPMIQAKPREAISFRPGRRSDEAALSPAKPAHLGMPSRRAGKANVGLAKRRARDVASSVPTDTPAANPCATIFRQFVHGDPGFRWLFSASRSPYIVNRTVAHRTAPASVTRRSSRCEAGVWSANVTASAISEGARPPSGTT